VPELLDMVAITTAPAATTSTAPAAKPRGTGPIRPRLNSSKVLTAVADLRPMRCDQSRIDRVP
jgi:hypothetical protein